MKRWWRDTILLQKMIERSLFTDSNTAFQNCRASEECSRLEIVIDRVLRLVLVHCNCLFLTSFDDCVSFSHLRTHWFDTQGHGSQVLLGPHSNASAPECVTGRSRSTFSHNHPTFRDTALPKMLPEHTCNVSWLRQVFFSRLDRSLDLFRHHDQPRLLFEATNKFLRSAIPS